MLAFVGRIFLKKVGKRLGLNAKRREDQGISQRPDRGNKEQGSEEQGTRNGSEGVRDFLGREALCSASLETGATICGSVHGAASAPRW